ncbi:MAG: hypothetical protein ABWW65_05120, partial [Thermoprotei archaeon]
MRSLVNSLKLLANNSMYWIPRSIKLVHVVTDYKILSDIEKISIYSGIEEPNGLVVRAKDLTGYIQRNSRVLDKFYADLTNAILTIEATRDRIHSTAIDWIRTFTIESEIVVREVSNDVKLAIEVINNRRRKLEKNMEY